MVGLADMTSATVSGRQRDLIRPGLRPIHLLHEDVEKEQISNIVPSPCLHGEGAPKGRMRSLLAKCIGLAGMTEAECRVR